MATGLSLDHIILPKDLTDGFYSTWHNYYGELFPSPVKPKYRPMSKIFSCDTDDITQSSPNLFEQAKTPISDPAPIDFSLSIGHNTRVGDNIDEFIRNNRKQMCRSSSLNDMIKELDDKDIFAKVLEETAKQKAEFQIKHSAVKMRPKSELTQNAIRKSNRFSWCGSQTIKFLANLPGKKKTYECISAQEDFNTNFQSKEGTEKLKQEK